MTEKLRGILVPVLAALVAAGAVFVLTNRNGENNTVPVVVQDSGATENNNPLIVGYATTGVTAVSDEDSFTKAVDDLYAKSQQKGMSLKYKYDAFSTDGVNFKCLLANSQDNDDDMFIAIYADETFQDELFLSELLRPGTGFEEITLNHPLERGSHDVVAAFSLVKTENGEQSITQQQFIGLKFTVQ
jgi:hypothetical protein